MSDLFDLAQAFSATAEKVADYTQSVEREDVEPDNNGYSAWLARLQDLDNQYNTLQAASTSLGSAYASVKLAGMEGPIGKIQAATADANQVIKTIANINKALHLVAAVVSTAASIAATIANPALGAPTLISSGQALVAAVKAYKDGEE